MADTKDPNSNITTVFKQTPKPSEEIRVVSKTPDPEAEAMVRSAIQKGSTSRKPNLQKDRIKKRTQR